MSDIRSEGAVLLRCDFVEEHAAKGRLIHDQSCPWVKSPVCRKVITGFFLVFLLCRLHGISIAPVDTSDTGKSNFQQEEKLVCLKELSHYWFQE